MNLVEQPRSASRRLFPLRCAAIALTSVALCWPSQAESDSTHPLADLAVEIANIERELVGGPLALCAAEATCGSATTLTLGGHAQRLLEIEGSLDVLLPAGNEVLDGLLDRLSSLRTKLSQLANSRPSLITTETITTIGALAAGVLQVKEVEPEQNASLTVPATVVAPRRRAGEGALVEGSAALVGTVCDPNDPGLLAETSEITFTPALDALLATLENDTLLVYEFVRDSIANTPYYGSRRSAESVLAAKRGNDMDQASLLIAALRRLGIPACYVRGTVQLSHTQLTDWLGVDDALEAATVLASAWIPTVFGSQAEIEHVWVEAYVDVADYRGIVNTSGGKAWIQLAPAFHALDDNDGPNLATEMSFDASTFKASITAGIAQGDAGDAYLDDLLATVATNHPGQQLADVLWHAAPVAEGLDSIPLSLPFRTITRLEASAAVPAALRHQVTVFAGTLSHSLEFAALGSKRLTIAYEPATPTDEAIVAGFGNIFDTPANLINVRPELLLDGAAIATGSAEPFGSVGTAGVTVTAMGYPALSFHTGTNTVPIITAGRHAIVVSPDGWIPGEVARAHGSAFEQGVAEIGQPGFDSDETLGESLFITGMEYFRRYGRFADIGAQSMQRYRLVGLGTAFVTPEFALFASGGTVVSVVPRGLQLDVIANEASFARATTASSAAEFDVLITIAGSSLEHKVFEDLWGALAVSTLKVLQLANDSAIPVFEIDSTNRATLVPQLTHPPSTVSHIEAWLDAGFDVEVPRDPTTLQDWTGTGWFVVVPANGFILGAIISGNLNGGTLAELVAKIQELVRTGVISAFEAADLISRLLVGIQFPVGDPVTSPYGTRRDPMTGTPGTFHEGTDFGSPTGTEVTAIGDGFIELQYVSSSFGNLVAINHGVDSHGNTYYTLHAHNSSFTMNISDFVSQGDTVALSGNTGNSTGPHVHFELRIVPPGVDGPMAVGGAPTNGGFFDESLSADPESYVLPELTLPCSPSCP